MQPYPRAPDLVWPGHLHGRGCLSARAVGTGFPTVGLRLWLGPGCGWSWVLFTPARCGLGLGWVCLGSVCGVVPLLPAVCGVRGWALMWACFRDLCGFLRVSLAPRRFRFRCAVWAPGSRLCPALLGWVVGLCFLRFFFFFFPVAGCPCPGPCGLSPVSFLSGWAAGFFFFFSACFGVPFSGGPLSLAWCCRSWLGGPHVPVWGSCLRCPLGGGFGPLLCCWWAVWWLWAVFVRPPPPPFFFFLFGGGGLPGCSSRCLPSAGGCSVAGVWCGWSLATPGRGSCVLLPATPGWVSLPVVVGGPRHSWLGFAGGGGVWCVAVVCWWGCGWCVVWLVPRHSWRRFLCATPRHSWLGFASGGVGRAPPLLAGVRWRRCCVVCGVWRWCVGGVVAGVWCGWSLATPGGGSCVLLPATPGWVSLPVVVGGPRHLWLGSACGGGVWCVVCGVWRWCVGGVVAGVWCGWSLATPGGGSCVLLPATPGWVSLPVVVGGPRHSWLGSVGGVAVWCVLCGGSVLVGLWLVCGVVGPSPLLAEVPVCYSPPLLAGFRCRWWWAVPATPGWGPLAALLCGVWCVALVCWWGCGWRVVWLVPRHSWRRFLCATPRHSWLGFAAGGGGRSPPLVAGVRLRRWCVVCGVWCVAVVCWWGCGWCVVWLVPRHSWRRFLCATHRHSWLGFAAAGGGRSPPLLAGVRLRRWCVVCCWGPSPLLAEVPVCYSPPLLAGFRCRWWWAVPATPGWGPLAAVVCVFCLAGSGGPASRARCGAPHLFLWPLCLSALLGPLRAGVAPLSFALSGFVAPGGRRCLAPVLVPWLWPAACLSGVPRGPAWCAAPRPVRSPSVLRSAFPTPWCLSPPRELAPPALLGGCAGHAEAGREPGSLCLPLAPAEAGALGSLRVVPIRGPAMGLSLAGPSGVSLGLRALRWLACVDPVTDASGFPYRPSFDGGLGRCTGAVSCGRRHLPLRVGGRHARVPYVFACACSSWPGRAGRPPGRVLVRLTFSFGRFVFLLCLAPSGLGLPLSLSVLLPFLVGCFSRPPAAWLAPRLCLPLGRWLLFGGCSPAPPPLCVSRFSSLLLVALGFFFFFLLLLLPPCAPVVSGFLWFPAPGALGLGACVVCFVGPPLLGSPCAFPSFVLSAWLLAASASVAAPPFVSRGFRSCRSVLCAVLCCASLGAVPLLVAPCPLALPIALGPCALRRCVLRCAPALCALCCVCFVVARWCLLLFAALPCAVCVSGCCAVRSLCSPFCAVLCFAVLVPSRCAVRVVRAVAGAWCCGALLCVVLFPVVCRGAVLGLVARGCLLVACFGVAVPAWPRGLLPCGWCGVLVCCGALLSCVVFCGAVLSRGAVLLCSAVVLRCFWGLLCPPVGCRAVLCCAVGWLCCFWPGGGVCVLWCSFPRAVRSLSSPFCALQCLVVLAVVPCLPVSCAVALCWVWCCAVVPCCRFAVLFVFSLPSCGLLCGACVVCAVVGASCCGVCLCVVVSPWAFCGVVVLLWCVVVSCCAVRCPVVSCALCRVLRCRAALRCCAVCFSFCLVFLC